MNNRELKFRAFYRKKLYIQEYCGGFSYFIHDASDALSLEDVFVLAERGECVLQQYTGLKDSKGVEIYEGDFVRYEKEYTSVDKYSIIAPLVFSPFGHGFVLDSSRRHGIVDSKYGDYIPLICPIVRDKKITYEVVGNIFENKTNE
jgi:uncharacterized phage protein (TIGR01671 family)